MTIGQKIKKLRHAQHITQTELGQHLNMTKSTVSMWERGERTPDISTVIKIAQYFQVSTDYLLDKNAPSTTLNDSSISDLGLILEELLLVIKQNSNLQFWGQQATKSQIARLQTALEITIKLNKNENK